MDIEEVLQAAKGQADEAEVYAIDVEDTPVSFEANRLKLLQTRKTSGLSLRLVKNGRIGFTSSTKPEAAREIVDRALAVSEFGAEAKFEFPTAGVVREVQVYDSVIDGLSVEGMVGMGQRMIDRMQAYNPDILCNAGVSRFVAKTEMLNSRGGSVGEQKTVLALSLHGNLVRDTSMLDIWEATASCRSDLDEDGLVKQVIDQFEQSRTEATVRTKEMPVIFVPKAVAETLLSPLIIALSGKTVLQGASPLRDRLGQQVLDERISLYDDGTIDYAPRSGPTDDEGVPSRRTALIEKGTVRNFYYDLQAAGQAGTQSTGNGFRSLESLPGPSTTNTLLAEGDMSLADMIADVKEGIIVYQVMGAWAGNLLAGDFSANVHLGFKIEDGRLAGRVKDTMVAGNVYEALKERLQAVGDKAEWIGGSVKLPALYFRSMSVSAGQ
ncbi:MAG: metallopeptidase TldD-related protein [Dehalococcoidales bacterium]|nr:metallopeptidase TldD-related protein [Dehalococcoidales bacterium]